MEDQAAALAEKLGKGWGVFLGMRYGRPSIREALEEIASQGIEELVVVPLYPQFSQTTTGTVVREVYRVMREAALHINITARTTWYDDAGYANAQAHLIADYARSRGLDPSNSVLLFSAHGLPESYIRRGDPYARQIAQAVHLVAERLGWPTERRALGYQSRMGPGEWLKPDLSTVLRDLAEKGERRVLVCPISFAVDCLETLEEIQIRGRQEFTALGGELFLCPALNTYERFMCALKNLVTRGPQPVVSWNSTHAPLFETTIETGSNDSGLDTLVLLGATLPNRVGAGRGPKLVYSEPDGLACAKRPHDEVEGLLGSLRDDEHVREAFVWNTCYRFECYAWLKAEENGLTRECAVARLRGRIFGPDVPGLKVNALFGAEAWHHLMRTIAGLNSGLPGDKDIVEQFQTAYQLAERVGTAGKHSRALVDEAVGLARSVREETAWGRLDPGYCCAAVARIQEALPLRLGNCRHVVIGGSTTSRSVLESLYEQFGVKESAVTLVYRNHQGGQMKLLRKAVGRGRRLRTHSYSDRAVIEAVADADVVYLGIDRQEPLLTADVLRGLRDYDERPLFILDFNTSGSTEGLEELRGVRVWRADQLDAEVETFAESMCTREEFPRIVQEAETWIRDRAPRQITPSLDLPCLVQGADGQPSCARCGKMLGLKVSAGE
jgi:ferrochelatase